MNTEEKNIWRHVKTIIHDALLYKKAKKKKCDTRNTSTGLRKSIITFGTIACILLTAGIALADPVADNDWNIPDINPSSSNTVGPSNEQVTVVANPAAETRLTFNNAYDRQPSWSKDGQWIAFVSTRGLSWDIWKVSKNGEAAGLARLTTYGGFDLEPNWNPSNKIVFAAGSGQGYEDVYTMNSDGTGRTRLTTAADFDEYADWSPDGSKIVYVSVGGQPGGPKQIWLMNADGTNKHRLNTEYAIQPAWSPDGTRIAFKCYRGGYNICMMNADGTNVRQLTQESADTHDPDWSPDSSKIIYASKRTGNFEIYTMNPDGTDKRQLTNNNVDDNFPSFSPDGHSIVFSSYRSGNEEIWTMPYSPGPIVTGITVVSPNGGENLVRGTTKAIQWNYAGNPGVLKIELLKAGVLNRVISSSISVGSNGIGSYNWIIPSTQTLGTDYKVRITSTTNPVYTDSSNNNFAISNNPSITVVSPNGGEYWTRGSTRTISWTSSGTTGTYVKIELLKSGVLNRVISSSTPNDGSYSWIVPSTQTLGSDYKIRITSTTIAATDTSNYYFRIL